MSVKLSLPIKDNNMFNTILQYTLTGNEKPIVAWTRMLSYISRNVNIYTNTVINGAVCMPPWVQKIHGVLKAVDVDALIQLPSVQRYSSVLLDASTRLNWILAPNYSVPSLINQFAAPSNAERVQEYIIPCQKEYPLMQLPLGKDLKQWEDIHPINIIYNDSTELCSYILKMQYTYKRTAPSLIIATVDIPSLVLKYCAYVEEMKKEGKEYTIYTYIKDQLMTNFYMDCVRCWVFTIMNSHFNHVELEPTSHLIVDNGAVKEGLFDLNDFLRSMRGKHFTTGDFISTKWIPSTKGPISIVQYMKWMNKNIVFPDFNQAQYLKFFTQYPLVYLLIQVINLADRVQDKTIKREMFLKLQRLDRSRILYMCSDNKLRRRISKEMRELLDLSRPDEFSP